MNGFNRNCIYCALDKPEYHVSLWWWAEAALYVAAFIGLSSTVRGTVNGSEVELWGQRLPVQGSAADGAVDVFLRPENVRLAHDGDAGALGTVQESTFLGSFRRTLVRTSEGELVRVQHSAADRLSYDDTVRLTVAPEPVVVRPIAV